MTSDTPGTRLLTWAVSVLAGTALGATGGTMLGHALARISYDYVVIPSDWTVRGLQLGLLAGTALGACQVVGSMSFAGWRRGAMALAGALTFAALGLVAGMAAGYAALRWGWMDTSSWALPNPTRHALLLGASRGLDAGALAGTVGAAVWLLRGRCASP